MTIFPTDEKDWGALKAIRLASLLDAPTAFGVSYAATAAYSEEQCRDRASARTQPEFFLAFRDSEAVGLIVAA
jgi:hypothetical protein